MSFRLREEERERVEAGEESLCCERRLKTANKFFLALRADESRKISEAIIGLRELDEGMVCRRE